MYHFISGLNDILKDFVISKKPETFEKAMNMAVLKDNLLKQSNSQSINNLTEPEVSKNGENVKWENILAQVLSQKDQSIDNSANERLLAIERKLETLCLSKNVQMNHQSNPPKFENVKCFECENWGHFRENCEMFKKKRS